MKMPDIKSMSKRKKILLFFVIFVAIIAIIWGIAALCSPLFNAMNDPENLAKFENWVNSLGALGVVVMLLIQIAQIVIAFIPGEFVQVAAGVMYGTWGGLLLCLVGCVFASAIIFALIRKLGRDFVEKFFGAEQLAKYDFLQDSSKVETLVFILFLIPGLPKDLLTYVVPLTPIKMRSFLVLSTIGRIPGMVASTLIGSSVTDANWPLIIGIFVVVIVVAGLGIWKKDAMMEWAKKRGGVKKADEQPAVEGELASAPEVACATGETEETGAANETESSAPKQAE